MSRRRTAPPDPNFYTPAEMEAVEGLYCTPELLALKDFPEVSEEALAAWVPGRLPWRVASSGRMLWLRTAMCQAFYADTYDPPPTDEELAARFPRIPLSRLQSVSRRVREDAIVRYLFRNPKKRPTPKQIRDLLPDRNERWVYKRAGALEIVRPRSDWSDKEKAILDENWGQVNPRNLMEKLPGRPWSGIRHMAASRGLEGLARGMVTIASFAEANSITSETCHAIFNAAGVVIRHWRTPVSPHYNTKGRQATGAYIVPDHEATLALENYRELTTSFISAYAFANEAGVDYRSFRRWVMEANAPTTTYEGWVRVPVSTEAAIEDIEDQLEALRASYKVVLRGKIVLVRPAFAQEVLDAHGGVPKGIPVRSVAKYLNVQHDILRRVLQRSGAIAKGSSKSRAFITVAKAREVWNAYREASGYIEDGKPREVQPVTDHAKLLGIPWKPLLTSLRARGLCLTLPPTRVYVCTAEEAKAASEDYAAKTGWGPGHKLLADIATDLGHPPHTVLRVAKKLDMVPQGSDVRGYYLSPEKERVLREDFARRPPGSRPTTTLAPILKTTSGELLQLLRAAGRVPPDFDARKGVYLTLEDARDLLSRRRQILRPAKAANAAA